MFQSVPETSACMVISDGISTHRVRFLQSGGGGSPVPAAATGCGSARLEAEPPPERSAVETDDPPCAGSLAMGLPDDELWCNCAD